MMAAIVARWSQGGSPRPGDGHRNGVHKMATKQSRTALLIGVATIAAASTQGAADIVEFQQSADDWLIAVPSASAYAFDEFFPGGSSGCLIPPPDLSATLQLTDGTVTVSAVDGTGTPSCAIADAASCCDVSDGKFAADVASILTMEFDPPITAFYTFYGSLAVGDTATMCLFSGDTLVAQLKGLESPPRSEEFLAIGHGFTSTLPIDRIEFTKTESGSVMIGAFIGLLPGEPSLGTVTIPGYNGPNGEVVDLDFALSFCPCPADLNDDGSVGVSDLLILLGFWGPCWPVCLGDLDGDGDVGVKDLLALLANWGPCP